MKPFHLLTIVFTMILAGCSAAPQHEAIENGMTNQTYEQLLEGIEGKHPVTYSVLASKLFFEERKDKATIWYYVGQIRYTVYLRANEETLFDSDKAMFATSRELIGRMINEYGKSDPAHWVELIDQAIEWDENNPDNFTPKATSAEFREETIAGFKTFRDYINNNQEKIKAQSIEQNQVKKHEMTSGN